MVAARVSRWIATVAAATAIVGTGLELGADAPTLAHAAERARYFERQEMPEFPGSLEYPLGEGLELNGAPLRISYFETRTPPERVAEFYARELETRGLVPRVASSDAREWSVTALTENGHSQVVVAIVGQAKQALVFPAIVPVGAGSQPVDAGLPRSKAAFGTLAVSARDSDARLTTWQEPGESALAAQARVRATLEERGWTVRASGTRAIPVLAARLGERRARYTFAPWPGAREGVAVSLHEGSEGSP